MKELMKKLRLSQVGVYKRIEKIKDDLKIVDVEIGAYCLAFQNKINISKSKYNIDKKIIVEIENALRSKGMSVISENVKRTKSKSPSHTSQKTNQKKIIRKKANSDKVYFDKNEAKKALSVIKKSDTLQLSKFKIISNYVRYDEETINDLKNLKQKIIQGINPKTKRNSNFLIWGPPGSGKTYLIKEIASSHNNVNYHELNLAKLNQKQFKLKLNEIEKAGKNCICLIDEVDSDSSARWVYESLLTHLSPLSDRKFRVCFILSGSGDATIDKMKEKIKSKNKGNDFLSRIPITNECIIPTLNVGDKLLVVASQLLNHSKKINGFEINGIDKLALFYILVNPQFSSARQITQLLVSAIERVAYGEDRMKWDHLFEFGDPINKEFWLKTKTLDSKLLNSFIHIKKN